MFRTILWSLLNLLQAEPWREADDLGTCETICVEKQLSSDEDVLVIDLDAVRGSQKIEVGNGWKIELTPSPSAEIEITIVSENHPVPLRQGHSIAHSTLKVGSSVSRSTASERSSFASTAVVAREQPVDADEEILVPVETDLLPLPEPDNLVHRDLKTATFQSAYASLMAQGRTHDAQQLAANFLRNDSALKSFPSNPRPLPQEIARTSAEMAPHHVGYRGTRDRWRWTSEGDALAHWNDVSDRMLSARFNEMKIEELATFLHWATGLVVDVDLSQSKAEVFRCTQSFNDATMAQVLETIARQTDCSITPFGTKIIIRERP